MGRPEKYTPADPRVIAALTKAFVEQEPVTLTSLTIALEGARKEYGVSSGVRSLVDRMELTGELVLVRNAGTLGLEVRSWVPTGADSTFESAVRAFLVAPTVHKRTKTQVGTVLRLFAREHGVNPETAAALWGWVATQTPSDVPALTRRVKGLRAGLSGKTREAYRAAWRRLLEFIAAGRHLAMAYPAHSRHQAWAHWCSAYFPDMNDAYRGALLTLASRWDSLDIGPRPATPDAITVVQANTAQAEFTDALGPRSPLPSQLSSALIFLGMRGRGPYAALQQECSLVLRTAAYVPRWELGGSRPSTADELLAILREAGLPTDAWEPFLRWYVEYLTLSDREGKRRWGEAIVRKAKRRLKPSGVVSRLSMLRVLVGAGLHLMGIPKDELTPDALLASKANALRLALERSHDDRVAEQQRLAQMGLPVPGGAIGIAPLKERIVHLAMWGEGLAQYAAWAKASGAMPSDEADRVCALARETYRVCGDAGTLLTKEYKAEKLSKAPTARRKDRESVVRDVSGLALVEQGMRRAARAIEERPNDVRTARLVQEQILGALVSTGTPRIGELAGLTYGALVDAIDQAKGGRVRYLEIDAARRKYAIPSYLAMPTALVPTAVWEYYRTRGRRLIAQGQPLEENGAIFLSPWKGTIATVDSLGSMFSKWRKAELAAHPVFTLVPGSRGHHGPHAERNRALALLKAVRRSDYAYALLGHTPDTKTEAMYGQATPEMNLDSIREILAAAPWTKVEGGVLDETRSPRGAREARREEIERWRAAEGREAQTM